MKAYDVKLRRQSSEKRVRIHATSKTNNRYEAEKRNPGWTVTDVRAV
jgi:hypothetical protein